MNVGRYLRGEDRHVGTSRIDNAKAGADIHAGDGGYEESTQEKYDEFVKIRNQSLAKMRIRELAERAGGVSRDDDGNQLPIALVGTSAVELFAELILRECKLFCGHDSEGVSAMFKHFGVKE